MRGRSALSCEIISQKNPTIHSKLSGLVYVGVGREQFFVPNVTVHRVSLSLGLPICEYVGIVSLGEELWKEAFICAKVSDHNCCSPPNLGRSHQCD